MLLRSAYLGITSPFALLRPGQPITRSLIAYGHWNGQKTPEISRLASWTVQSGNAASVTRRRQSTANVAVSMAARWVRASLPAVLGAVALMVVAMPSVLKQRKE